ncbi:MAG TPA: TonB-dependent receptor [Thermoanaerobaculia bacterium]|nr:TonB-dependent receptor [Thermoanaerobaculia bacterium]
MCFVVTGAWAQEQTAAIMGVITDSSGAVLPGVSVEAVNAKGQRFATTTDSSGAYRFPSLPPGLYTLTATLQGMETATVKDLELRLGQSPKINLTMRLPRVAETLTVTAEAPLVDVTSSATATSIRSETFEKLPKGRDFSSVVTLLPSANFESKQGNSAIEGGGQGVGGIQVDGASGSENRFIIDGVDTTHPRTGGQTKVVFTDFVDEVQVKSAGYEAEFGGAVGGTINVITKSGTNDFRGTAGIEFEDSSWGGDPRPTLQVSAADATKPEYKTYRKDDDSITTPQVSLGGPILRDRLWFFGAYAPYTRDTDRTVTFTNGVTNTFPQKFERDTWAGSISGNFGSRMLFKVSGNNSGYTQSNALPDITGRAGSSDPAVYRGQNTERENWSYSGYADFVANPQWYLSARGGRYYDNVSQKGIPTDPMIWFASGSNSQFPDTPAAAVRPAGFRSVATNRAVQKDAYTRDNFAFDASWYPTLIGSHRIKGGVQIANLKNEVLDATQNYIVRTYWNSAGPFGTAANRGKYGMAGVYVFGTIGNVDSKNTGFFLQDSWTTFKDRLTLNFGVRTEQEKVPNYADPSLGLPKYAINFDYGDKVAPRLGFSYDVFGNGRSKVYGSWGKYYDITKLEMPRGSFGGDKWIWFNFAVEDPDWTKWQCSNVTSNQSVIPTCTGGLRYAGTSVDLRHPSLELIEPDLKPMESNEFTLGVQHELANNIALGVRYVNKHLVRTIEDVGVLVINPDGSSAEEYFIANPGFGVAKYTLGRDLPAQPKAKRDYQAIEIEGTKRFSNRWGVHASYVYSRLEGNYSGLTSSDENGRMSPNVNRYFDNLFSSFDAKGKPVYGRLATDRPHVFKAQLTYAFPWGTGVGLNQYIGSGTPITTEVLYEGVPFYPYGRGDLGRTPTLKQTDLQFLHDFRFGGRYGVQLGLTVLNVFDEDTAINRVGSLSSTNVTGVSHQQFFQGFDPIAKIPNFAAVKNPLYNQDSEFQAPRQVRVMAKFTF